MEYRKPDNYIHISAAAGASNKFIVMMIAQLINDIYISEKVRIKDTYDYHVEVGVLMDETNLKQYGVPSYPVWNSILFNESSKWRTMVFSGGASPVEYNQIVKDFPDFKHVVITMTQDDWLTVEMNHFYKLAAPWYYEALGINFHERYPHSSSGTHWKESIPVEESKNIVEKYIELREFPYHEELDELRWQKIKESLPDQFKSKLFLIKFSDIVKNPEKVLSTISEVSGKYINQEIKERYYKYVELQFELYRKYMPWQPILSEPGQFIQKDY